MNLNIRHWFCLKVYYWSRRYVSTVGWLIAESNPIQMLFFGSRCERLCMIQFSLISLIPGLINNLGDCADPAFDNYTQSVEKPTSLRTSERSSCMPNYVS